MIFLNIATIVVVALTAFQPCKHALHMFQQNRYELTRYTGWLPEGLLKQLSLEKVGFLGALLLIILGCVPTSFLVRWVIFLVVSLAVAAFAWTQEKKTSYIKPLVLTDRVKRQIAVLSILFVVVVLLVIALVPARLSYGILIFFAQLMPWGMIYVVGLITTPIEHAVQQWYINDAKKILEAHRGMVTIGITGSYGKTSTKNVMQSILSEQFNTLMTPASYNTPMGITRTIREYLKPIHQVFVCEMGADKVGDITELMNFVHPSIGVVTSIGPQHLATFGSQDQITREKMQMIELLPKDGYGILNYDNEFIRNWNIQNPVAHTSYAIDYPNADYRAEEIQYSTTGSTFTLVHGDERISFETKLLGKLNILNILSAIAAARYLKVSWKTIQAGVKQMKQVEHRLEQKKINGHNFIDDAFNANPSGAAMALEVLSGMPAKRWIVTPGMIDLGSAQATINETFGKQMTGKTDEVLLVGRKQTEPIVNGLKESGFDMEHVQVMDTVKEAFAYLYAHAGNQDVILLENDLPDAFSH